MHTLWSLVVRAVPGVLLALVVQGIIRAIIVLMTQWPLHHMEGCWLEVIEDTPVRRYSLGQLEFSYVTNKHHYDGTNYSTSGDRKFSWETTKVFFDRDHRQLLYIYEVTNVAGQKTHGFGLLSILPDLSPEGLGETSGYFVDAETANSNVHPTRFFLAHRVAKKLFIDLDTKNEESRKNFILQITGKNWP
jgi:hypothetical protein